MIRRLVSSQQPAASSAASTASRLLARFASDKSQAQVARFFPYKVRVEKGKTYHYCTCGASKKQPFCDGSHKTFNAERGTDFAPKAYVAEDSGVKLFCACKQNGSPSGIFCDMTHVSVAAKTASNKVLGLFGMGKK